ncbi:MAG: enoyl-CoA hydratase [Dehalococcoidia bacterium]|nr:enoyl-CoA hydratase [Dehalococcoidia bacterium]
MAATSEVTQTEAVLYEKKDHVAWVIMNRPDAMNAKNDDLVNGVARGMRAASEDPDVYVAILIGEGGRAFSAGNDLRAQTQRDSAGGAPRQVRDSFRPYDCTKPTIAAVDGFALGGGMQWASQCDIRVATERSQFGQPEPRWGLAVAALIDTPERYMPWGEASYLLLTGTRISAKRAYDVGYVQSVVPDRAALITEVERIANEVKLCAPLSVRLLKRTMRYELDLPLPPQGQKALEIISGLTKDEREAVGKSEDRAEGPKAFSEKRPPQWKMR